MGDGRDILSNVTWMGRAACRHSDQRLFLSHDASYIDVAKSICAQCPVRLPCLEQFWDVNAVVAGMTRHDRLTKMWKRMENPGDDTNWSGPDCLFEDEIAGK